VIADVLQLRFATLLKQLLALKVSDPGRTLSGDIVPTFDLQDPYRPEQREPRGERLFGMVAQFSNTNATFNWGTVSTSPNHLVVVKRLILSLNLPTSVVQPGNVYFAITGPSTPPANNPVQFARLKDSRYIVITGGGQGWSQLNGTSGGASALPSNASPLAFSLFPGAAAVPTLIVVDNLDLVVFPNADVSFMLRSDTLATATYSWTLSLDCYERTIDPNELLSPPP
jgi:hypothetical protein